MLNENEDELAEKEYVGDGVYLSVVCGMIKLTAENGIIETDTIYLEPFVYESLARIVQRLREQGKF